MLACYNGGSVEKLLLIAIILGLAPAAGYGQPAILTWYGSLSDGYLGARHGASWHGDSCGTSAGSVGALPEVVDLEGYGVAAPAEIPYCSRLLVCTEGGCVVVTVVDRMRDDLLEGRAHLDLWPAPAEALGVVGPGVVAGWYVRIE